MNKITVLQEVPDFVLPASDGREVRLSDYRGRKVILYFYPKDMTSSCTQEACDFRDAHDGIMSRDAVVLGVSPDPASTHSKFREKHGLPFLLLSDEDHTVSEIFGVWQLKKNYGREYMGIVRSTFLIDENGILLKEWRNVRVKGHVQAMLDAIGDGSDH